MVAFCAADTAQRPMIREMISLSWELVSRRCNSDVQGVSHHVEGISHQSQRVGEETGGELEDEEGRVKSNHDLDAGALGPRHLLEEAHDEGRCAPATA